MSLKDGLTLYNHVDLNEVRCIGELGPAVSIWLKGVLQFERSYQSKTNICVLACRFCAFRRGPKASDAYAMSVEDYLADLSTYAHAVDEVYSVGGLHPDWGVEHYETLFSRVALEYPEVSIKALTAVEIKHLAQKSSLSTKDVLKRFEGCRTYVPSLAAAQKSLMTAFVSSSATGRKAGRIPADSS